MNYRLESKFIQSADRLIVNSSEKLQQLRAIWVLEKIGSSKAKQLLEKLAIGAPEARQTIEAQRALKRLQRELG